jgi:hypothetical protein
MASSLPQWAMLRYQVSPLPDVAKHRPLSNKWELCVSRDAILDAELCNENGILRMMQPALPLGDILWNGHNLGWLVSGGVS